MASNFNPRDLTPEERNVRHAAEHLGQPELIAAKVREHGDNVRQARLSYEALADEHHDQLSKQGIVGLPEKKMFCTEVARRLLNMHAALLLQKRLGNKKTRRKN